VAERISQSIPTNSAAGPFSPRTPVTGSTAIPAGLPASVASVLGQPGQPLAPGVRAFFEPRFGHDFSAVRVHTGADAEHSAREVGAEAYTVAPHIVLRHGAYAPETTSGRNLLAHELTHAIQQGAADSLQGTGAEQGPISIRHRSRPVLSRKEAPDEPGASGELEAEEQTIDRLLSGNVRAQDVSDVLLILRSFTNGEDIAVFWERIDPDRLGRFLRNLEVEHFAGYPLEVMASVAALDDAVRDQMLRAIALRKPGATSQDEAARALFLLMDVQVETEEGEVSQLRELLDVGDSPRAERRSHQRQNEMAELIRGALPMQVRAAIADAVEARDSGEMPPSLFADEQPVSSELARDSIVDRLEGNRIGAGEAREVFEEFSALYQGGEIETIDATVQRLEERQSFSPWLERLAESKDIDLGDPTHSEVFACMVGQRPPALAMVHILELLDAGRPKPSVLPEQALLARRILDAYPSMLRAQMRLELASFAGGDLTQRLAGLEGEEAGRVAATMFDEWLANYRHLVAQAIHDPLDLLEVLQADPGAAFVPIQPDFPALPVARVSLAQDLAALDRFRVFDVVLDQLLTEGSTPPPATLARLIENREAAANVSSVRRLAVTGSTPAALNLAFRIQQCMPEDQRAVLAKDADLWGRMAEELPPTVQQILGAPLQFASGAGDRNAFTAQLNDPTLWTGDSESFPRTLRSLLTLAAYGGLLSEFADAIFAHALRSDTAPAILPVLAKDESLWADIDEVMSYGSVELNETHVQKLITRLGQPSLWRLGTDGRLSDELVLLLRLARFSTLARDIDELLPAQIDAAGSEKEALKAALIEMKIVEDVGGVVSFASSQAVSQARALRETKGVANLGNVARAATGGVEIEADNLVDWLTENTGVFVDVPQTEGPMEPGDPNTFTVRARVGKGLLVEASCSRLDLESVDVVQDGLGLVSGMGFLEDLDLSYSLTENKARPLTLSASAFELNDIVLTQGASAYAVGRVRLDGIELDADVTTGVPFLRRNSRINAILGVVYALRDSLLGAFQLVMESITPSAQPSPAMADLAGAMVSRFENRFSLHASAKSVLLEGLVMPGLGSVEQIAIAPGLEGAQQAVALSLTSNVDWDRLMRLRELWERGTIMEDELDELGVLERQAMGLALGFESGAVGVKGTRGVFADKDGVAAVRVALETLGVQRAKIQATLDPVKRGEAIPTDPQTGGMATALAQLAALDDGIYEARFQALHAVLENPSGSVGFQQLVAPRFRGGSSLFKADSLHFAVLPDGSSCFLASGATLGSFNTRASSLGLGLDLHGLHSAEGQLRRVGGEFGALVEDAPPFPQGKEGDWLAVMRDVGVDSTRLKIDDLSKLGGTTGECKAPSYMKLLDGVSGILIMNLDAAVPTPLGTVEGTLFRAEFSIDNGLVRFRVLGPIGPLNRLGEAGMRSSFGLARNEFTEPLSVLAGTGYETFMCPADPTTAPASATEWYQDVLNNLTAGLTRAGRAALLAGSQFTDLHIVSQDLKWSMPAVDLADYDVHLKVVWGPGGAVPLDMKLDLDLATGGLGNMVLTLLPFSVNRVVGEVMQVPIMGAGLKVGGGAVTVDFIDQAPKSLELVLNGVRVDEVRVLLEGAVEDETVPKGGAP
jgi:hypothetical protein